MADPMAEKYFFSSPYCYVDNNPIVFIDPNGEDKVIAIVYNQRKDEETALWAVQLSYDINKELGSYVGMLQGKDYHANFQGKFDANNKSNFLNASIFTENGALGMYHQSENGQSDYGFTDANITSFDVRWNEDGIRIPTAFATAIADGFDIINNLSILGFPAGEEGADAINKKFKEIGGKVEYFKDGDGNPSFRFSAEGNGVSFMIDYVRTDEEKSDEELTEERDIENRKSDTYYHNSYSPD